VQSVESQRRLIGTRSFHRKCWRVSQARNQHKTGSNQSSEDGCDIFLPNVGWLSTDYTALYPRNNYPYVKSFIHQWLYSALLAPALFFSPVIILTQSVGLLGRVIIPSQGLYLNTGQHKHRTNAYTGIHALSGIRTHDPSVRASEDSSFRRPRGHCDQH
jgi:hypothetical protein